MPTDPPVVMLAMNEPSLAQVLTPELRARLDAIASVVDVRPAG